ncbi:hypothetical protein BG003_001675 [Podila horticola]|nr:hypothetical protein BG003_001675 [Podila horticola]
MFIQTPAGKTITLQVDLSDSINNVKQQIHDKKGIPSVMQLIIYHCNHIKGHYMLADFHIHKNSFLELNTVLTKTVVA